MDMQSPYSNRKSLRLRNYDYSSAGAYFVTLCVQDKYCLFGGIVAGEMHCNAAGQMLLRRCERLAEKFPDVSTDAVVIMPNHVHFILFVGADPYVRPSGNAGNGTGEQDVAKFPASDVSASLPTIVQWFKTMTTNDYVRGVKQHGWPSFAGKLWQRNYYEHVIRSEASLQAIREYIANNPAQWHLDQENPAHITDAP